MKKAVFFDLGDIFFEAHYWRKWMWSYFKEAKLFHGNFAEFYNLYESYITTIYSGNGTYDDMYLSFINDLGLDHPGCFIPISYSVKRFFEENRTLYPNVKETLIDLRSKGVKVVVITDNESPESVVRNKVIEKFGINELVDTLITSHETGATKPSPIIFQNALDCGPYEKNEVLFVAHDVDEINGALEFGLDVVEFNNYLGLKTMAQNRINYFQELLLFVLK